MKIKWLLNYFFIMKEKRLMVRNHNLVQLDGGGRILRNPKISREGLGIMIKV